jgi:hypothetical protein
MVVNIFFYCHQRFLPSHHQLKNNIMDFLKGKAKIDVALPVLLCEKVYDVAF